MIELAPSPKGRTRWPWTEKSSPLSAAMLDGSAWPRISIVTPSYNQGQFLEETIRSFLLQNYPNYEYFVMDGGSQDQSVGIIKKYQSRISYWVSQPDHGQAGAIEKGFALSSGDILAYINSDDFYIPNAFAPIANAFQRHRDVDWLIGQSIVVDETSRLKYR
jgi:glycosyltransferase involved in cell wall biosynthesis